MAVKAKKSVVTRRTKRSAAVAPPEPAVIPEDFLTDTEVVELARRAGVSVTAGTLRNYRYRWSNGLPGEHGPMWYEGSSRRIRYQKSDVLAWLDRVGEWTPKGGPTPQGTQRRNA
jgi:hypothetical protein